MKKIEFGTSEKVSGVYFFNEKFNKYQINIDCVNWMLIYESYRFDSLLEAQNFINSKYNVNYTLVSKKLTKSEIFKAAHKLAATFEGNYKACLALALKQVYASQK